MEKKATEDCHSLNDKDYRLVFKLRDGLHLPFLAEKIEKEFTDVTIHKLFTSLAPEKITSLLTAAEISDPTYSSHDFFSWYAINVSHQVNPVELLRFLRESNNVDFVYVENGPVSTPSFFLLNVPLEKHQLYVNPAPQGIDARYAWAFPGGQGNGKIKLVDVEQGWNLEHECLNTKTLPLTGINHPDFSEHGSAALGVITMKKNKTSGMGITPKIKSYVISQWRPDGSFNSADAILSSLNYLNYGDILLLESQAFDSSFSSARWPLEIHPATFQAIRLAAALGVIVIEAAGNGDFRSGKGNDLDDFKLKGKKIFDPSSSDFEDSGSILVAAATATWPHKRIIASNYGRRINCYAWGENVVTTGNYPQTESLSNAYTAAFGGTSSAAAIVAGAAVAVQSVCETNFKFRLSPKQMRNIFSDEDYGTASFGGKKIDKIGVMPDLKKIIEKICNSHKIKNAMLIEGEK